MEINIRNVIKMIFLVIFLTILPVYSVNSQVPQLYFKHLSVEDGLSQSTVRNIFQDRMGFMWFATDIGINKYDGNSFTVYKYNAEDSLGIPSNFVIEIYEDSFGFLWVGTGYSGISRFDRELEIFHTYINQKDNKSSISDNNIRAIFEDSKKNLWIGTAGGGLNLYNRKTDSFIRFFHDSLSTSDIGSNFIASIAEDKKGNLWLGSADGILTCYNTATHTGKTFKLHDNYISDRLTPTFGKIFIDSDDNIWFGNEFGLFFYDQKNETIKHFVKGESNRNLNENAVSNIKELKKGIYIIATDHGGINLYNSKTGLFTYYKNSKYDPSSISNDQVYTIFISDDGLVWIGNYNGGINIFDPGSRKFKGSSDLAVSGNSEFSNGSVLKIIEDAENKLWFGYDGQGMDIYDPKTGNIKHLEVKEGDKNSIQSNSIIELFKAKNNDLWIGTYLKGMSKLDWKTKKFTHYVHNNANINSLAGNNVWSILEDSDDIIWIGFQGTGLDKFDPRSNTFVHYTHNPDDPNSLSNNDIFKIFEDSKKNLWISTRNGLCLYIREKDCFNTFISNGKSDKGTLGNWIFDIYEDVIGNIWIGTDQGLNVYYPENKTFEFYSESDGLNGNAVRSITSDNKNNIWFSTNKGISKFDLKNKEFRNYDIADGLQGNEFNYVSVLKDSRGLIYFGGKNGFNYFSPDSIFDNPIIPRIYFTKLFIDNNEIGPRRNADILEKHINFQKKIILKPGYSIITFEFAALSYSNPQKNQYAYYLENFDKEWKKNGNKQEVTYTNLNPGKYILKVKASNNDSKWNENGISMEIIILPPWWKNIWFKILMYLIIIGLLFSIYYIRMAFYENQQKKLMVLVRERTFQLEEVAVTLEEKQEEINIQNDKLLFHRDELEKNNMILTEQKKQILEQNEELDRHRNRLESLVDERTKELIEAKNKAEESDRLKSSFLANLSHEIRTPLNAILGFSSLLGEKNLNDDDREEFNRIIQGSSNTLLDLISDILDISKIEAGQLELDMQEASLEAIINDVVGIFEMFMTRDDIGSNKTVELKVAIDDNIRNLQIITDSVRLTQILSNLVNNAIKFTKSGYIEVGCSKLALSEMLEFYVKDTGIGIKEEYQRLVFERFRKVEEDKMQLHRGTGLGLAISYQLVNLMGGSMRLTSKFGEGSTFYFTIPMINSDSQSRTFEKKVLSNSVPDFGNLSVLVAEDEVSNFFYIEKLLKKANLTVYHAENGKSALKIMDNIPGIKLILMDIKMPIMDGIECLHEVRKKGITVPVFAQTAYALADEIVKLKKEGFDEYISKPIMKELLYSLISKYLEA